MQRAGGTGLLISLQDLEIDGVFWDFLESVGYHSPGFLPRAPGPKVVRSSGFTTCTGSVPEETNVNGSKAQYDS